MSWLTAHHLGILFVVAGTVLLALSVEVKRQYVDQLTKKHPDLVEPTETYINRSKFWIGLALVAIGSALQW